MNRSSHWFEAWVLALFLAMLPWTGAQAAGATGQQESLMAVQARSAPLALSSDGKWRLHVDADRVLHRVFVSDVRVAQQFQLPLKVRTLSASRSGRRVAFTSDSSCVGLVDFGAGVASKPTLRWLPSAPAVDQARDADAPVLKVPGLPADHECGGQLDSMRREMALSDDGRWLATADHVLDVDTQRVIATLNINPGYVLRFQFLPDGKKLFVASAVLGDRWEGPAEPSHLQFSVWDPASGKLDRLISMDGPGIPQEFFQSYSAATDLLFYVDSRRHRRALAEVPPRYDVPLELHQTRLGGCKSVGRSVFPMAEWDWQSMVVDPLGRWVAGVRSVARDEKGRRDAGGVVEWLEVFDLSNHQLIAKRAFKQSGYGLVPLPDGSAIFGLTGPGIDQNGWLQESEGLSVGDLVRLDLPLDRLKETRPAPEPWQSDCLLEDEVKGARNVQRQDRKARLLWSVTAPEIENPCDYSRKPYSFVMPDQTLWVDDSGSIQQIDARTGKALKKLPAPYKAKTCHLPVPASGGFVSYEGDMLVWRVLESGAIAPPRLIDRRPGWRVWSVRWDQDVRALVGYWMAKPESLPANVKSREFKDFRVVLYHPQTLVRLSEVETASDANEIGGDGEPSPLSPCQRAAGPQTEGHDWRLSHFDSFRAYQCGPSAGQTRTVLWSHIDIRPDIQPKNEPESVWVGIRRVWGEVDGVAVAQDGKRLLVYEIASRRELAHFESDSFDGDHLVAVHLLPQHSLVVVETHIHPELGQEKRRLSAYAYR